MQLKSLEINGFKSFANKAEFDFDAPITAIVGPNGSGKSNAVEAFRFALGEQSMKSMRSSKGEDLLFNGSRSVSRANRASVKVTFDNKDRALDIDFDEVTIKRVVHRDSANEYHLNGSEVRLKDITELLAKANIGPSGHHIISQGEADRILNVNTRERKEMIEDALGLKVYHYKIEEAEKKLSKTKDNLKDIKSLHRELQPRLNNLKEQVEKVKKAQQLRKELTQLYKAYFKRESIYILHKKSEIQENLREPTQKLKRLKEEKAKLKEEISKTSTSEEQKKKKSKAKQLKEKIATLREKKDKKAQKLGQVEGEISSEERALERERKREQTGVQVSFESVKHLFSELERSIEQGLQSDSTQRIKQTLQSISNSLSDFVDEHSGEKKEQDKSEEEIKQTLEQLRAKKNTLTQEKEEIERKIKTLSQKHNDIQEEIAEAKTTKQTAEKRMLEIEAKESDVQSKISSLKKQQDQLEKSESAFKQELGEAGRQVNKEATEYESYTLTDDSGAEISRDAILKEDRNKQKQRMREIEQKKAKLANASVDASKDVMSRFEQVKNRNDFLESEIDDLQSSRERLRSLIKELESTLDEKFRSGVKEINEQFQHFFSVMFGGGEAEINVVKEEAPRSDDEYKQGVAIDVHLPYKRINSIEMLSGGERALTSIALLFAITQINPPPFLVLDEMDAALDEANSRKYGDLIEDLSEHSQLVLITHNRETMSRADHLYGITMGGDGVSQILSVAFEEAVQVAKE